MCYRVRGSLAVVMMAVIVFISLKVMYGMGVIRAILLGLVPLMILSIILPSYRPVAFFEKLGSRIGIKSLPLKAIIIFLLLLLAFAVLILSSVGYRDMAMQK